MVLRKERWFLTLALLIIVRQDVNNIDQTLIIELNLFGD